MKIVLSVIGPCVDRGNVGTQGSNPPGPGHRSFWTEDLGLEEYDGAQVSDRGFAGTHSGFSTLLREARPGDRCYAPGSFLFHVECVYWLQPATGSLLPAGQITAEGLYYDRYDQALAEMVAIAPHTLAITGGTGAYVAARGQLTEGTAPRGSADDGPVRTKILDLEL